MTVLAKLDQLLPPDPRPGPRQRPALVGPAAGDHESHWPTHLTRLRDSDVGGDRSGQTHELVAAAVEWGLTDEQVQTLAAEHMPSVTKYGERLEAEVLRLLGKQRPRHDHIGQPCNRAACPNKPGWMGLLADGHDREEPGDRRYEDSRPRTTAQSWLPVDLAPYLDGTGVSPAPTLLRRRDGAALLYRGRVHWCSGEPEALKSWWALLAVAQVLADGGRAVYLDLEDGAAGIAGRLLALGITPEALRERFNYISPDVPLDLTTRFALEPVVAAADLLVVDAATEALALQGLEDGKGTQVATWLTLLPRWAARLGPAVVVLDHVVKDADSRGRWATGSGHKLAGLDGAAYQLEAVDPAGPGRTGRSRLYEVKDRHGQVRRHVTVTAGGRRWAGDLVVTSVEDGRVVEAVVHPPTEQDGAFLPTIVMRRVSDKLAAAGQPLSGREVEVRVGGKATTVRQALAALVDLGHVEVTAGPHNSKQHRLVKPYPDPEQQ